MYPSLNVTGVIKSRRVSTVELEMRNAYKVLVGKYKGIFRRTHED